MNLTEKIARHMDLTETEWEYLYDSALADWRFQSNYEDAFIKMVLRSITFEEFKERGRKVLGAWRDRNEAGAQHIVRSLHSNHAPGCGGLPPLEQYDPYSHPLGHTHSWENTVRAYEEDH